MRLILIANNVPLAAGLDKVNIDSKLTKSHMVILKYTVVVVVVVIVVVVVVVKIHTFRYNI